ncbi:MAG: DOPA 4,5-dioxygenase family protein [Endozoicomonas sp. (ex Botrylloides leachii)]|nr:DOPA 4,5-dioxygenase family protein [Endozoicomonas sp. (ex Botrylloides leachii)]
MSAIKGYHAHVYFELNPDDADRAHRVCQKAAALFPLSVGRLHTKPIGPHPKGSCQLAFNPDLLGSVLHWLIENRNNLTVFIHTITGDDYLDHTDNAFWLGSPVTLNLKGL